MGALVLFLVIGVVSAQGYFGGYFSGFQSNPLFFSTFYLSPFSFQQNFSTSAFQVIQPQPSFRNFNNIIGFTDNTGLKEVFISATLKDGVANALIEEDGKRKRYTFAARDEDGIVSILATLTGFSKGTVRNLIEFRDLGRSSIATTIIGGPSISGSGGVSAGVIDRNFGGISSDEKNKDIRDLSGYDSCKNMFDDFDKNEDLRDVRDSDVKDCEDLFNDIVDEVGKSKLDNIDGFNECEDMFDDFDKDDDLTDAKERDFKDCENFFDDIKSKSVDDLR